MKRVGKRLALAKETLSQLENGMLSHLAGGLTAKLSCTTECSVCPSCPHITCQGYTC